MTQQKSLAFDALVGASVPAAGFSKRDYLIDQSRFASEGNWAFCRFASDDVPAVRFGFQRGGFNGGSADRAPSASYLQLHLELMTKEGAFLWLPSGVYPAETVVTDLHEMDIRLDHTSQNIFTMRGWPSIECHFRSEDGVLQSDLRLDLKAITILPDCILPQCLFAMWESMGEVSGLVRFDDRTVAVNGKVFLDHTRVVPRRHAVVPRQMYVYTTMYFDDGSGMFGYHSLDINGRPIEDYCFGVYVDVAGKGRLLSDAALTQLVLDDDHIAKRWRIFWRAHEFSVVVDVTVQSSRILRCWGSPDSPQKRRDFSIIPLVLEGSAQVAEAGKSRSLRGYGLAEYFNAELWPPDKAAMQSKP